MGNEQVLGQMVGKDEGNDCRMFPGDRILKEEDCPEWYQLQVRQALWRSVPLAVVGFCLTGRVFLEVPSCQLAGTLSLAMYLAWPSKRLVVAFSVSRGHKF